MRPLTSAEIEGTWATVLTPFDQDDALNEAALDRQLDLIIDASPSGMYTHGTAGEFFNQTDSEWLTVVSRVATRSEAASLPFQVGASHPSPVVALERIRLAGHLNPSAIQVILPDWLPLSRDETRSVLERYSAAAGDVGLVLYNPPHAKNVLLPDELDALTDEFSSIVGLKVADGDADWYESMATIMQRVSVFVPGHHLATGLAKGAKGAYSNVACLHPAGAVEWARRSMSEAAWGLDVEKQIAAFLDTAIAPLVAKRYSNVTLDKALAAAGGHLGDVGHVRWPHVTASDAEVAHIRDSATTMLPAFLRPAAG
ncbi:dihydrodipicolinate synthase family protein [Mycetocola miduiensis]|uniref:Dihydrodipicolinate synthase/N-acetylneuraminate lyase n=1 Tax=Mycetocola miduiensis TaxID=995034 RepID=A0A1I5AIR9_9MICO|nr:dihydrodipicolinate synthase family protein [Mycetocola miduiensis]SFN62335.1 Dihydrodipicolinate synthase/N-acetylneuraminate lyase [Mycetocola miduiensis]